jgi:hypothetical protein
LSARRHQPIRLLSALATIDARQEQTGLRDAIQRLALKHRHYGYRRIGALLRREGWQANRKRARCLVANAAGVFGREPSG